MLAPSDHEGGGSLCIAGSRQRPHCREIGIWRACWSPGLLMPRSGQDDGSADGVSDGRRVVFWCSYAYCSSFSASALPCAHGVCA